MQVDTPRRNLYDKPDNVFVAGFIDSPAMNLVDVDLEAAWCLTRAVARSRCRGRPWPRWRPRTGRTATLGFRPGVVGGRGGRGLPVRGRGGRGAGLRRLRLRNHAHVARKEGDKLITLRVNARQAPMKGETIYIEIPADEVHVFSAETGRRVSGSPRAPPPCASAGPAGTQI